MAKKVKMSDIADRLQVSTVTVSKALSDRKGVSEEMRSRIKELAIELGYEQPGPSKTMEKEKSYNVGVIVPDKYFDKYESFYWYMYQEIVTKAVQKGCFTMLEAISRDDEENLEIPKLLLEDKVDGLILIGRPASGYVEKVRMYTDMPILCLDFFDETNSCDAVISNGFNGTYLLTNYLFSMGHKEIAYVGTLLYTSSITDRYFGYAKSMLEHGKKVPDEWILDDRDWESGDVTSYQLRLPRQMPTAFVCNSDLTASMLIKRLRQEGYRVPEDISVVGFDNYLYPGLCDIGITSYEVDVKEMVRKGFHVLLRKLEDPNYRSGIRVVDGNVIFKDSVHKRRSS